MAYSYPNIDGIHLWQVMRGMEGSKNPPKDRILLERYENENSTDFVHLGYPGYPNEAGISWINLIKGEFVSNFSIEGLPGRVVKLRIRAHSVEIQKIEKNIKIYSKS